MTHPAYPAYKDSGVAWLGAVPAHWCVKPLKRLATVNDDVLPENVPKDYTLRYVDISSVDAVDGIVSKEEMTFEHAPSRARRRVKDGDIIISTVRTYLKAIARVEEPEDNLIVSTGFAVIRSAGALNSRYAGYVCGASYFIEHVIARSVGVSYPAINASDLMRIAIPVPPLREQAAIAAFLDRETATIAALIARQERLIALLGEKRQAIIAHAVTKGLRPDAPMRDSGVPWLGAIPAHWSVVRNKVLFREFDERSTTGDEELLTVSHITGVTPRSEKNVNMIMAETLEGYKKCHIGDLVINTMWAWMGAVGLTGYEGLVSPSYNVYRPRNPALVNRRYFDALYRTPAHVVEMTRYSKGIWESRLRLYPDAFFSMLSPLPPPDEQANIMNHITEETTKIGPLIAKAQQAITLMREHRTSLIAAAVTGKIDLRGVMAEEERAAAEVETEEGALAGVAR